ncbi:hypothetical protein V2W30_32590 [Streptomyces sp. Q6]|uniref:Uncharacterized protein n=1 Tax=Streptomyces citrinus TaxID=3118173 RepID=A0ACD5AL42_9ACTN
MSHRDLSAEPTGLPATYEEFVGGTLAEKVENISDFRFVTEYQKSGPLSAEMAEALVAVGYRVLNDFLELRGIHYLDVLEARTQVDGDNPNSISHVEFTFGHDLHHCAFIIGTDRFEIHRRPSSFADFYSWYLLFMAEAERIEATFRRTMENVANRPLRPARSQHTFVFYFSDFVRYDGGGGKPKIRNTEVLKEIVPNIPDSSGRMASPTALDLYRLDLTISKREKFKDPLRGTEKPRNTWITIEAPFNENGRFIVFTAQLRNTAAENLSESTIHGTFGFDSDSSSDYRIALVDFLRDGVLDGFVKEMFRTCRFRTQRQM